MKLLKIQKGQALPVGMAVLLFLALTSVVLFNTGQITSDKTRIVNTADSAAYSGLLWQARAMNFTAYTNRAMVANQVAMAQAVSINSWAGYIKDSTGNLYATFGWVPYLGQVLQIMDAIGQVLNTVLDPISLGMLNIVNVLNTALSFAQEGMYYTAFAATPDVVGAVVKTNDLEDRYKWETGFTVFGIGQNLFQWESFTEQHDTDDTAAMKERAALIRESTDQFTDSRHWKFFKIFLPVSLMRWYRFEKHGETKLIEKNGKYEWKGKDALSLREKRYRFGRSTKYRDKTMVGADQAFSNETGGSSYQSVKYRQWLSGGRHKMGQYWADGKGRMSGYSGIQAYRSLSREVRNGTTPDTMQLRVEVKIDADDLKDAHHNFNFSGNHDLETRVTTPIEGLTSISTAELFYEKPCIETICTEEYANGYNPFWDVRLAENTGLYRLGAYALNLPSFGDMPVNQVDKLEEYSYTLANPLDDYKEQTEGFSVRVQGWPKLLDILATSSPQYIAVFQRIEQLEAQLQGAVDEITANITVQDIQGSRIVEMLAEAAGYGETLADINAFTDLVQAEYDSLEGLQQRYENMAKDKADELKVQMEEKLKEVLTDIVKKILLNAISSATGVDLENIPGAEDYLSDQFDNVTNASGNTDSSVLDDTDIVIDLSDECSTFESVQAIENTVEENRARFETMQEEISAEFIIVLGTVTTDLRAERSENNARINEINAEISELHEDYDSGEIGRLNTEKRLLQEENAEMGGDRVDALASELSRITAEAAQRADIDDGFNLSFRDAKRVVEDILGDTSDNLEIDEDGRPAAEVLFFGEDPDEEDESHPEDLIEEATERPEGC